MEDLKRCKKMLLKCTGIVQAKDPPTVKLELSLKISKNAVFNIRNFSLTSNLVRSGLFIGDHEWAFLFYVNLCMGAILAEWRWWEQIMVRLLPHSEVVDKCDKSHFCPVSFNFLKC